MIAIAIEDAEIGMTGGSGMAIRPRISGIETRNVESEDEAWRLLALFANGEDDQAPFLPKFGKWPKAEFTFWIDGGNAVLTAPVMEAMLEFQSSINRAFMLAAEGSTNLRGLSEEERSDFEALFKIKRGSSKVEVDLQELCKEFIKTAVGKLSGRQITVLILSFALLFGGEAYWKAWLEHQKDITVAETQNQQTKELLASQHFATEADLKKMQIMHDTVVAALGNRAIVEASNESRKSVLKAAARVRNTQVAGQTLPPEIAKPMARSARSVSELDSRTGEFDVLRVDTNVTDGFRVRLRDRSDGTEFFASVRDRLLSENDRSLIQRGEWEKKPIAAQVHITKRRGEIVAARIGMVSGVVGDELADND